MINISINYTSELKYQKLNSNNMSILLVISNMLIFFSIFFIIPTYLFIDSRVHLVRPRRGLRVNEIPTNDHDISGKRWFRVFFPLLPEIAGIQVRGRDENTLNMGTL